MVSRAADSRVVTLSAPQWRSRRVARGANADAGVDADAGIVDADADADADADRRRRRTWRDDRETGTDLDS